MPRRAFAIDQNHVVVLETVDCQKPPPMESFELIAQRVGDRLSAAPADSDETSLVRAHRVLVKELSGSCYSYQICNRDVSHLPDDWRLMVLRAFAALHPPQNPSCLVRRRQLAS